MVAGFAEVIEAGFLVAGPIRTECAIVEHTVPHRIDSLRRMSFIWRPSRPEVNAWEIAAGSDSPSSLSHFPLFEKPAASESRRSSVVSSK